MKKINAKDIMVKVFEGEDEETDFFYTTDEYTITELMEHYNNKECFIKYGILIDNGKQIKFRNIPNENYPILWNDGTGNWKIVA